MIAKKLTPLEALRFERIRQQAQEGYDVTHDDAHKEGELLTAARCYFDADGPDAPVPVDWPFEASAWKPKDRRSNLVRSGALVMAERERELRATDEAIGRNPERGFRLDLGEILEALVAVVLALKGLDDELEAAERGLAPRQPDAPVADDKAEG